MAEMQQIACPKISKFLHATKQHDISISRQEDRIKIKVLQVGFCHSPLRPLGKLVKLSKSQFHHLYKGDDTTYVAGFF